MADPMPRMPALAALTAVHSTPWRLAHDVTKRWDVYGGDVVERYCSCGERWTRDVEGCPEDDLGPVVIDADGDVVEDIERAVIATVNASDAAELLSVEVPQPSEARPVLTADDLWRWLTICLDCGEPHEYRPITPCGCCEQCTCLPRPGRTWASPVDGHPYNHRGLNSWTLAKLRAEWEADRG